jgi:hypothetical protein
LQEKTWCYVFSQHHFVQRYLGNDFTSIYDFVAWLVCLGTAIAGIFKNQATLTDIGIPS